MSRNPSSPIKIMVGRFELQEDGSLLAEDGTQLYQWPSGWRYVPPPAVCEVCAAPVVGLYSWHDHMGRLCDFAGCDSCARTKKDQLADLKITPRAYRL